MVRAVLDTNVIVSSLISPHSPSTALVELIARRQFELLISSEVLAEYEEVLRRPRTQRHHKKTDEEISRFLRRLSKYAEVVAPAPAIGAALTDPDDIAFLECALGGKANVIVSGDNHLLALGAFSGILIVTPASFFAMLGFSID